MAAVTGIWNIEIATPVGVQKFTLDLTADGEQLTGTVSSDQGERRIAEGVVEGDLATFKFGVTKPIPLTLNAKLTVDGDSIAGTAQAGAFPPANVTGARI